MFINSNLDLICFLVKEQFSTFDGEDHECALWLLLKRSQSEDKAIRLQAVQDLASNSHWHGNVCWSSLICPRNSTESQLAVLSLLTIWREASSFKKHKYALKLGLKHGWIIYISSSCSFLMPWHSASVCSAGLSLFPQQRVVTIAVVWESSSGSLVPWLFCWDC